MNILRLAATIRNERQSHRPAYYLSKKEKHTKYKLIDLQETPLPLLDNKKKPRKILITKIENYKTVTRKI